MSSISCAIIYENNPTSTYKPGEVIKGEIKLTLLETKKVRGITLTISGIANCRWHDSDLSFTRQSGQEKYLKSISYLLGSVTGPDIHLPAGTHSYVFSCTLPDSLPSSFEGKYGYVRYSTTVELKRNWNFDESFKTPFSVISPLNLALDPTNANPVKREISKTFWKLPWSNGSFTMIVEIPIKGYVPGEAINIGVKIQNNTIIHLHDIKFILKKFTSFHTDNPLRKTKTEETVLVENYQRNIASHVTFVEHRLIVPSVAPSNLLNCRIIDIHYYVRVVAKRIGLLDIEAILPITIGTIRELPTTNVPINNTISAVPTNATNANIGNANDVVYDFDPPPYEEFPPSYSQAVSSSTRNLQVPSYFNVEEPSLPNKTKS